MGITSVFCAPKDEYVVCIHGFMGGPWSMRFLEKNLKKDGWNVINWGYSSRNHSIQCHAKSLVKQIKFLAEKSPKKPIHFVAHSMGGLVLLSALNHPDCPKQAKIGKVILIAPPVQGSTWARWLNKFSLARKIAKDFSGKELMTKPHFKDFGEYPSSLEKVLVIAGNLGFNPLISNENDGTITVSETFLPTPHEQVIIKRGHKTIIFTEPPQR